MHFSKKGSFDCKLNNIVNKVAIKMYTLPHRITKEYSSSGRLHAPAKTLQLTTTIELHEPPNKRSLSGHMTQTTSLLFLPSFLQYYTFTQLLPSTKSRKQIKQIRHTFITNNTTAWKAFLNKRPLFMGVHHQNRRWSRFLSSWNSVSVASVSRAHVSDLINRALVEIHKRFVVFDKSIK